MVIIMVRVMVNLGSGLRLWVDTNNLLTITLILIVSLNPKPPDKTRVCAKKIRFYC